MTTHRAREPRIRAPSCRPSPSASRPRTSAIWRRTYRAYADHARSTTGVVPGAGTNLGGVRETTVRGATHGGRCGAEGRIATRRRSAEEGGAGLRLALQDHTHE